jgi:hypothetical protein
MKKLIWMAILLLIVAACGKSRSMRTINEDLDNIAADSTAVMNVLGDELRSRRLDSMEEALGEPVMDTVWTLGDTISWTLRAPVEKQKVLEDYDTDTLKRYYDKNLQSAKVIYGHNDNRKDWYEMNDDPRVQQTMLQTVCLIKRKNLKKRNDGSYELKGRLFHEAQYLCTAERFYTQPVGGFCSGFVVDQNRIATAGHCVESDKDLEEFYIVLNFLQDGYKTTKTIFSADEVFTPVKLEDRKQDPETLEDYAIVKLDRPVSAKHIATIRETKITDKEAVFVIGHPCGLPVKYADGAKVINNQNNYYFIADLDTYGGNSGSPVYDTAHNVVGILVRGERDFVFDTDQTCYFSHVCETVGVPGCSGETISRSSQFLPFLRPLASANEKKIMPHRLLPTKR